MKLICIVLVLFLSFNCLAQLKIPKNCDTRVKNVYRNYVNVLNILEERRYKIYDLQKENRELKLQHNKDQQEIARLKQELINQIKLALDYKKENKLQKKQWYWKILGGTIFAMTMYQMGKD